MAPRMAIDIAYSNKYDDGTSIITLSLIIQSGWQSP